MFTIFPFSILRYLRFECNFTHGVIEAPNFEFAGLKRISIRLLCQLQAWSIFRLVNPSGENLKVTRKRYFSPGQLIEKYILNTYRIFYLDIHWKSIKTHGTNECYSGGQGIHHVQVGVYPYSWNMFRVW